MSCSGSCTDVREISYDDLKQKEVRSLIFHLLYAMDAYDYQVSLDMIVDNFNRGFDLNIPYDSLVYKIADEVINERDNLDALIKPLLHNWRFDRVGVCTKLILRLAMWELKDPEAVPNIVINEAIELAKCFAEFDAYKFVNGILDEALNYREKKEAEGSEIKS